MHKVVVPGMGLLVLVLAAWSLTAGVVDISLADFAFGSNELAVEVLLVSRLPRTIALALAGSAMAVSGLLMQLICRNRFVEPSTAGTVEAATIGLLAATILMPDASPLMRMLVASAFALAGTALFLVLLARLRWRSTVATPLLGLMLGAVFGAIAILLAARVGLSDALAAWAIGDFSGVLRGRYESLWLALALTLAAYVAADRFTAAGMGEAFSTNLGLHYRRVVALGVGLVGLTTAVIVATVGAIPFLGLIVPNVVTRAVGDNMRAALPIVALAGAALVLLCDVVGRLVAFPYEIPVGIIIGMIGGAGFLLLLLAPQRGARG